jgi:hypothetical protein
MLDRSEATASLGHRQLPVICAELWRNRGRRESVRIQLSEFQGNALVDVRIHALREGKLVPTPRGVAVSVRKLPQLAAALAKAERMARELGLLPDDRNDGARP